MTFTRLGNSGLEVSRICLGGMSFGRADKGSHAWTLNEADSREIIRHAVDLGMNFFDTANVYSDGDSEEILGRALRDFCRRDEIVVATKVFGRMRPGPNAEGLSRKSIMAEIDASLKRLRTEYVDLYQIHRFDPATPVEETMEALHDVVRSGKARYIGASSMYAWQFAKMQTAAKDNRWTRFISMQNHLNLLYREEEREVIPLCADLGVELLPWSPLARGKLARPWGVASARTETDQYANHLYDKAEESDRATVASVQEVSERLGRPMAQVALAWVLGNPQVASPIIGATKASHLDDAVAALNLVLDTETVAHIEASYTTRPPSGY